MKLAVSRRMKNLLQGMVLAFGVLAPLAALGVWVLQGDGLYLNLWGLDSDRIFSWGRFLAVTLWGGLVLWGMLRVKHWLLSILFAMITPFYVLAVLILTLTIQETEPRYFYFTSPDGALNVIVKEESWLFGGWGSFYEPVSPCLMRKVGDYGADDGFRPFTAGAYELEWGESALIVRYGFESGDEHWVEIQLPLD